MVNESLLSPNEFFGFRMGTDRKLARWDMLVKYYQLLDKKTDKIKVFELGKSTEGNPFILAIITSSENMKNLEKIRENSLKLAYLDGLSDDEAESLIKTGKAVVAMTMSIHASEVGGTQMAPELAYELITSESPDIKQILDEVVFLLFPCVNPDGNIMTVDWYNKWLGTEYEGGPMPWLYHKYTGHDNNRDLVMNNIVESRLLNKSLYVDWFANAHLDFHHMGSYGARLYCAPYSNPTDPTAHSAPDVDPLVWVEQQLYGGGMLLRLEQEGKTGIESQTSYPAEFFGSGPRISVQRNMCGMTSESASAKIATPIYIHYHQLQPAGHSGRMRPEYKAQINFPHPWPGGWWRLRDIVEQQKIQALATLEIAAKYREAMLRNLHIKAKRSRMRGRSEAPFAYIFHPFQHDPLTMLKLLKALMNLGIKIHKAEKEFNFEGVNYPSGTYIIFLNQITRPLLLKTLRQTFYHESPWTKNQEGEPIPPTDLASYNITELMGVKVVIAAKPFEGNFKKIEAITFPIGLLESESKHGYILDGRLNDSFKAINRIFKMGFNVYRTDEEIKIGEIILPSGSYYIAQQKEITNAIKEAAKEFHLTFYPLGSTPEFKKHEVKPLRIAVYQRFWGGNMDEGWTRWLLEQYGFNYTTVKDKEIMEGLKDHYDALILPSDATAMITGEKLEEYFEKILKARFSPVPKYPPEYHSGIKKEGVEKLKEFVEGGGTLITLNEASNFALEELKLPITNVLKDLKSTDFFCPGSTLNVEIDRSSPLAYGIPEDCFILFLRGSMAFEVKPGENNEYYKVVINFPDENILQSGWLIGEKYLSRRAALLDAKYGNGRIVLFGFPPQFRAETHATFKFLFNTLIT